MEGLGQRLALAFAVGHAPSQMPSLGREDSLAELENSFHKQMMSGEIPDAVHEEEEPPPSPTLERDDSLAQLERSFQKQVILTSILVVAVAVSFVVVVACVLRTPPSKSY